jgi:hypothetical protein
MENLLNIACQAAGDRAVWICAHCESNVTDSNVCDICDQPRWSVCDVECECTRPQIASVAVFVDLSSPAPELRCPVQVPLPYRWEWEIPENYAEMREGEGPVQLRMRLN